MEKKEYQDAEWIYERAKHELKLKPFRTFSGLFNDYRVMPHFSYIGDYVMLFEIKKAMNEAGHRNNRRMVKHACHQSEEYRSLLKNEKQSWLDELSAVTG